MQQVVDEMIALDHIEPAPDSPHRNGFWIQPKHGKEEAFRHWKPGCGIPALSVARPLIDCELCNKMKLEKYASEIRAKNIAEYFQIASRFLKHKKLDIPFAFHQIELLEPLHSLFTIDTPHKGPHR